jgi:Methyltransferase domain
VLRRIFDKRPEDAASQNQSGSKVLRYSGAWAALRKRLQSEPGLRVIDAGSTSPTNINYLTSLGHSIFLADPVSDAWNGSWQKGVDANDSPIWDIDGYLNQTLQFAGRTFDVILLWTALDYLPEPLVVSVVDQLHTAMNPGGQVLAFFHTKAKGDDTAYCRFGVTDSDTVEMQITQPVPIQRAFTNRSIQSLFSHWSGFRQFLAKDSLSEVIITR